MSLSGALNNAIGGLTVNARAAGIVSSNIANALTEGYARRELVVSSDSTSTHGGVRVEGVARHFDPVIQAQRRAADADAGAAGDFQAFYTEIERVVGTPTDENSLTGLLNAFEGTLIAATADPSSNQRLTNVAQAGDALAKRLNSVSNRVQETRMEAEVSIESMVDQINDALVQIKDLNTRVSAALHTGQDSSALLDERQKAIDSIAELVPLRVLPRDRDTVALITTGGAVLLDGTVASLGFTRSNQIAAESSQEGGGLSGLTLNGRAIHSGQNGPLAGGRLAAQFAIRDQEAVAVQNRLDALALDLAVAFGAGGPDTTLSAGEPGLFTDNQTVAQTELGLSQRLRWNAVVAPSGGAVWKLRDGLGAAGPGPVGDATLLNGLRERLSTLAPPASSSLANVEQTLFVRFSEVVTQVADARVDSERSQAAAEAQRSALKELEYADGVDSDAELERLMKIEQNFAANAQVISVVDDLMKQILNI